MKRLATAAFMLALIGAAFQVEARSDFFSRCAHQYDLDKKIISCIEASRSTRYPWILQWVYWELARVYRERGDIQHAIASYARSLVAEVRETTLREMSETLTRLAEKHESHSMQRATLDFHDLAAGPQ